MKSMSWGIGFLLLTLAFGATAGVQSAHLDFPLTDGAYYFEQAQRWALSGVRPDREWSPLFVIGYGIHHWIFPGGDPLRLYLVHRLLVLYSVVFLFWVLSRKLFSEPVALLLALGLLGHGGVLYDYPVVHVAGLGVILVLLVGCLFAKNDGTLPVLMGLSCLGIWIRPEILFILIGMSVALIPKLFARRRRLGGMPSWGTLAICILISLAVFALSSPPSASSRSFDAFSQRYGWAKIRAEAGSLHRGHMDQQRRLEEDFGRAESIVGAAAANPGAFLNHVAGNVVGIGRELPWIFFPGPQRDYWVPLLFMGMLVLLLEGGAPVQLPGLFYVISGSAAAGAVGVALLLEPAAHYLMPAIPLVLLGGTLLLKRVIGVLPDWRPPFPTGGFLTVAGAGFVLLTFLLIPAAPFEERQVVTLAEAMAEERSEPGPIRVQAFSSLSYCSFLRARGITCQGIPIELLRNRNELASFLLVEEVNVLVADDFLRQFYLDSSSPVLGIFEDAPHEFGFEKKLEVAEGFLGRATLYIRSGG